MAPHNFYGHLSTFISAHFSAAVPNVCIMEIDLASAPWRGGFVTATPVIENGELVLPNGPGCSADINEAAVRTCSPRG